MGFKNDITGDVRNLDVRVAALETLAATLRSNGVGMPASVQGTTRADYATPATGVDYAAVAFGLSEIARKVGPMVGGSVNADNLALEYKGTVQYFSDVFAKSDASFDADEFKRLAGA